MTDEFFNPVQVFKISSSTNFKQAAFNQIRSYFCSNLLFPTMSVVSWIRIMCIFFQL